MREDATIEITNIILAAAAAAAAAHASWCFLLMRPEN